MTFVKRIDVILGGISRKTTPSWSLRGSFLGRKSVATYPHAKCVAN